MIRASIYTSPKIYSIPIEARWTFMGLISHGDDCGFAPDSVRWIIGEVYPHDEAVTEAQVSAWLAAIIDQGLYVRVQSPKGEKLLFAPGFCEHQRLGWEVSGSSQYIPAKKGETPIDRYEVMRPFLPRENCDGCKWRRYEKKGDHACPIAAYLHDGGQAPAPPAKKFTFTDLDLNFARRLKTAIDVLQPSYFAGGNKWDEERQANEFRLIREVDKRSEADIDAVLRLFPKDVRTGNGFPGWASQIRSATALRGKVGSGRAKFEKILEDVHSERKGTNTKANRRNEIVTPSDIERIRGKRRGNESA